MKYLLLPVHLIKFWYPEALVVFLRTWKNLILYLEEDLAVTLMWKLIFVPLFHDSTIVGRILSFIFRFLRILLGLFAFALASAGVLAMASFWFTLPVGVIWGIWGIWGWVILFCGVGLFIIHIVTHPHKTLWQVKGPEDLWQTSWIKKEKLSFQSLLSTYEVRNLLTTVEITPEVFSEFSITNIDQVGIKAFELAKRLNCKYINSMHFFVASLNFTYDIEPTLLKLNLKVEDFEGALSYIEKKKNKWRLVYLWDDDFAIHHLKGINRGWLGVPTPVLDSVSLDLTKAATSQNFPDIVGRSNIVSSAINILSEEGRRNVIIVGPPGAGKSALIQFLAKQILAGDAPPALSTKRLVTLDTTRLLSGIRTQGELAERIKQVFDEVSFAGNVILVVEEIHNLGIGETGGAWNLYSLILPYLESSAFQFIATTEQENYTRILEKQGAFARLFTKIELPPTNLEETLQILEEKAIDVERRKKLRISFIALKKIVELSSKLIHDRVLPDSAVAILNESETLRRSLSRVESRDSGQASTWVTAQTIEEVVVARVKVPVMELGNVGKEKLLNLESEIHQKLIDQEEAVKAVADSLRRSATGIREQGRPIGSFLFIGPTGVGKTELAKILAEVYFSGGGAFLRFDMSEYQSSDSVNKLIGAPGQEGQLTEAVRNKQYCLILLDEFEKADPKILTLFLQVLEDGRLTDGARRTVDFTNTIIIVTSNAASLTIAHGLENGQTLESLDKQVNEELLQIFKPELINRFDDVILFKPLSEEHLQRIVRLKLRELQSQMKEKGYLVEFNDELVGELAKRGYDPILGARPLRRLIQDTLEAKLSKMILENQLVKGEAFRVDKSNIFSTE